MIRLKIKYKNPHPTMRLAKSYLHHHHQNPANPTATLLILQQPYQTGATARLDLQMLKPGHTQDQPLPESHSQDDENRTPWLHSETSRSLC